MDQRTLAFAMLYAGSFAGAALSAVLGGVITTPASAQQLYPFASCSQSPPIFEYIYINYAIERGFLKKEGIDESSWASRPD